MTSWRRVMDSYGRRPPTSLIAGSDDVMVGGVPEIRIRLSVDPPLHSQGMRAEFEDCAAELAASSSIMSGCKRLNDIAMTEFLGGIHIAFKFEAIFRH